MIFELLLACGAVREAGATLLALSRQAVVEHLSDGRTLPISIQVSRMTHNDENWTYRVMSDDVSLTLCDRTNRRYALAASRTGSTGAAASSVFAELEPEVAGTTPAFTKALNKLAISGTGGAVEVDGTEAVADANNRDKSIGSTLGCSNDVGYDCCGGYEGAGVGATDTEGGEEYDGGAWYCWGSGAGTDGGGGDEEAEEVVRVRNCVRI